MRRLRGRDPEGPRLRQVHVSCAKRCMRCEGIFRFLVSVSDDPVDIHLDCGHDYEDIFDDHPPDWMLGVVLTKPEELQALWALETGLRRLCRAEGGE